MADSRLMMNIKGISISFIPRFFFQRKLFRIFDKIGTFNDSLLEEIVFRVNYYNKIMSDFDIKTESNCEIIGRFPFKKTSLAYDGYKLSKYFNDTFLWLKDYNDVNYVFEKPTICKSRPLTNENYNNILLKLDSNRHFCFLKDRLSFEKKKIKLCLEELFINNTDRIFFNVIFLPKAVIWDIQEKDLSSIKSLF
ncbi:hypothetical protein OQH62_00060 [Campylobacter sp. MIT 21-1684]|uniref:hypothetical protein n=1 Tax=Campylobacter sp. MIT 21-1684 TaxID=2994322 RepID=UPI00224B8068|nr:hypothetical protein [Campylobacter sp. MIT 21-1684]MCX2682269.1 hypothetical protein [Campylobacter sp. MIT 21-1684]